MVMSDMLKEDEVNEVEEGFEEVEVDTKLAEEPVSNLDARRRLEKMLEERRLRDELDDFVDY